MVKLVYENSYGNKVEFTYKFPYFLEQYEGIHEKASELYLSLIHISEPTRRS